MNGWKCHDRETRLKHVDNKHLSASACVTEGSRVSRRALEISRCTWTAIK